MINYSSCTERQLLEERELALMGIHREQKRLAEVDRALDVLKSSNGGKPKREDNPAETQR